jgi:ABC-type nickel/cobalt efflux system permease component RcnA
MIMTILLFVGGAILLRERALNFLDRTALVRERIGRVLEAASALLIISLGLWLFATRAV